jgi:protein-tyrosine-phosphatase
MKEIGIHLGEKMPRPMEAVSETHFDYIISLDDTTAQRFRNSHHAETIHWKIDDPLAGTKDAEDQLRKFRAVRDQIAQRLRLFVIVNGRSQDFSATTAKTLAAAAR